jgi:Leucine-rich repeat (LRR) protein
MSFRSNNLKGLNFLKIWKIINRRQKIIFDSVNEVLSEGLDNNSKKNYDYMFLHFDMGDRKGEKNFCEEKKLVEFLLNDFNSNLNLNSDGVNYNNTSKNNDTFFYILSNYIEEKIKTKEISPIGSPSASQSNKYIIVCKCITLENLITKNKTQSTLNLEKSIEDIVNDFLLKNPQNSDSDIIEVPIENNRSIFLYKNKSLILPEYLVNYDYLYSNPLGISIEHNSSNLDYSDVILSSYTNKYDMNQELIENFNFCCKKIYHDEKENLKNSPTSNTEEIIQIHENLNLRGSSETVISNENFENNLYDTNKINKNSYQYSILNSFDFNFFQKYQTCNFSELNELDSTSLFFCKSSIIKFMSKCFHSKYSNVEDFLAEIAQIKEKILEIQNLSFKYNKLENILSLDSHMIKNLKIINFFNSNLDDEKFNQFLSCCDDGNFIQQDGQILSNLEEIKVSKNNLKFFDLEKISKFENLKILDFSHNLIENLKIPTNNEILKNLKFFDISFNLLTDISFLLIFITNSKVENLDIVNFIGNPYPKEYFCHFKFDIIKSFFGIERKRLSSISEKLNLVLNKNNYNDTQILQDPYAHANATSHNKLTKDCIVNKSDLKQFDILYETFSLGKNKKYKNFSENNEFFRQMVNKEKASLILLKKKFTKIPNFQKNINDKEFINVNFSEVKVLYLNLNKISKIENLQIFPNLEELYLQNNKISNIENLKELKFLQKLDISNNLLQDIEGISQAKNLFYINIENNLIKFLSISELTQLDNLTELHASGNLLSNLKEILDLKNCPKLQVLDLSNNDVVRLNIQDFRLNIIFFINKLLILNKTPIEKFEYQQAKEYFDGKITLDLLENKLVSVTNSSSKFDLKTLLSNLEELNLSNCKLKDSNAKNDFFFDQSVFSKLKKLDLSRNCLTSFKVFGNLPSLVILNLNCNLFEKIINRGGVRDKNEKFEKTPHVPQIPQISQIQNPHMKSLPFGISGITNVENLELAENSLSDITGINILKNLRNLNLRQNNLNKIDPLDNLPNLLYLDLSFNKLRNLEKSNVGNLPVLKSLSCDSNFLKNINAFSKLQSLVYATFDNNKISEFPNIDRLSNIEPLKELNLSNNPITKNLYYRNNIIKKFINCNKIDNLEISKEEKELAQMELQLEQENSEGGYNNFNNNNNNNLNQYQYQSAQNVFIDRINFNSNTNNTINYNSANSNNVMNVAPLKQNKLQEKFPVPMKVNMINLDLLSGNKMPQNPSLNIYLNNNLISPRNKEPLSLPQIQTRKNPMNYLNPQVIQSKRQIYQRFNTNLNVMSPFGGVHVGNVNNFAGNMYLNQYYAGAQYLNHNNNGPHAQSSSSQMLSMKNLSNKNRRSNGGMTPNANLFKNVGEAISGSGYPPEGRGKVNSSKGKF